MNPDGSGIPGWFVAFFVLVAIVMVLGIAISVWRFFVLRSGGLNPVVAREQLEAKLNRSQLAAPPEAKKSVEQRLDELADLHERGVISDAELATARARVIAGD